MVEIKNREEANKYYKLINNLIDDFIEMTNARPIEVYNYLKKHSNKFLENNDLKNVKGINRILSDVLDHRKSLQMDKIITFENYNSILEDIGDLKSKNTYKEKILSDFFHISSGHIDILNQDLNIYKIKDFEGETIVTILSESDLNLLRSNLIKLLKSRIENQNFNIDELTNEFLKGVGEIKISQIIDDSKLTNYLDGLIDLDGCIKYFQFYLLNILATNYSFTDLEFLGDSNGYKIWKLLG